MIATVAYTSASTHAAGRSTQINASTIATCVNVLSLPHTLAEITRPCSTANIRNPVTANSRAMITIATHASSRYNATNDTNAAVINNLSANRSSTSQTPSPSTDDAQSTPSNASVADAITNTIAANRSASGNAESNTATNTGINATRTNVNTFAALSSNISASRHNGERAAAACVPYRGGG